MINTIKAARLSTAPDRAVFQGKIMKSLPCWSRWNTLTEQLGMNTQSWASLFLFSFFPPLLPFAVAPQTPIFISLLCFFTKKKIFNRCCYYRTNCLNPAKLWICFVLLVLFSPCFVFLFFPCFVWSLMISVLRDKKYVLIWSGMNRTV